jgi:3-oxoacyl-[acyl-carrier protein] reductase
MENKSMKKNENVFITGGSRGIGKAIVYDLAHNGYNIAFTYNKSENEAQSILLDIQTQYPEQIFSSIKCDISSHEEVKSAIKYSVAQLGGNIDVLVNNAGINKDLLFFMMDNNSWNSVLNTNINGAYYCVKETVLPMLKAQKGVIINITSIAGITGNLGQSNYSTSKAAIIGFTKTLSKELGPKGIRVNAVAPGFIDTDMAANINPERKEIMRQRISLGKIGKAEDVAKVVSFLCSDDSSYITGQTIQVDGGMSI